MEFLKGAPLARTIKNDLRERIEKLAHKPVFVDVLVGEDLASAQYVAMKYKAAQQLGIEVLNVALPSAVSTEELVEKMHELAAVPYMAGIIVQLPLPDHVDAQAVFDAIPAHLDVDILGAQATEDFYANRSLLTYPAAQACYELLQTAGDLSGKNIVIIGQGKLVGRPLTHLLRRDGHHVHVVTKETSDKAILIADADVLVSAAGVPHLITGEQIKNGAILIDAGTTEQGGGVVGDIDTDSVAARAAFLAPVPGGVGPLTVGLLFVNVVTTAEHTFMKKDV